MELLKLKKSAISVLLAAAFSLTLFAGCAKTDEDTQGQNLKTDIKDLGGMKFCFATNWPVQYWPA